MDNLIVGLIGAVCFVMAETSTTWFDNLTPLGIVGLVVYFFLFKFDKKLDIIEDRTRDIQMKVDEMESNKKCNS